MSPRGSIASIRREAEDCRACPLWRDATQTVFGEGSVDASLMLVGEQPGDREDLSGHPFVGPAGAVLDDALEQAGIARSGIYMTNAVKHFKYRARGKRRIHQRPSAAEQAACRPWLERELKLVKPVVVVALGATAAHALIGRATPIGQSRGRPLDGALFSPVLVTAHPSSVLRERERYARHEALAAIVSDLQVALSIAAENVPRRRARA
jgi:uracil-DNA glycosylase family protein